MQLIFGGLTASFRILWSGCGCVYNDFLILFEALAVICGSCIGMVVSLAYAKTGTSSVIGRLLLRVGSSQLLPAVNSTARSMMVLLVSICL